ncbi:GNAT family N-acetyltransferase [Streptococcus pantholopis]|uniref:GNAT family acetyltransferase n=1 Tax=Streptococcus pantholopis TaxID=1811193 RepID=A0A172Q864_9STRE|nr:GNAT family N-acetyltransferase [Streptococcus pantholopis]AND79631.1 GNAT family acetyltransferase [Streptococcus pantholopis]
MDIWTELGRLAFWTTERLIMRPFTFSDSDDFWAICSNPQNLSFIFPAQASRQESDCLLVHYFMMSPLGIWAVEDQETGKMIGAIRFEKLNPVTRTTEIGYFLHRDFWGRGYMTECLQNLVDLSFTAMDLQALKIIVHKENAASRRVAQKSGFRLMREFKGSDRYSHKMRNYTEYQILKGDYDYE